MGFKIGSINMYKFNRQSNRDIKKDLRKISQIILEQNYDIIALQEVFNEPAVRDLQRELGSETWKYVWEAPISKSVQAAEGYAFLWNSKRFRLATGAKRGEKSDPNSDPAKRDRVFTPRINQAYKSDEYLCMGKLLREPLYARFEALFGWYEVRLINTHIIYGSASDKTSRMHEFNILVDVYRSLSEKQYRNTRKAYTILLGDYNLSLLDIDKDTQDGKATITTTGRSDRDKKQFITVQEELTTLKARSPQQPDVPAEGYANNYDHFSFGKDVENLRYTAERVDSVHSSCWNGDFELHKKEFSDHVPISLTVEFK